jgi:hypothetical protein
MPIEPDLTPASREELLTALSYALRLDELGKEHRHASELTRDPRVGECCAASRWRRALAGVDRPLLHPGDGRDRTLAAESWPTTDRLDQAQITTACMIRFLRMTDPDLILPGRYPALDALSARCEEEPELNETYPAEYVVPRSARTSLARHQSRRTIRSRTRQTQRGWYGRSPCLSLMGRLPSREPPAADSARPHPHPDERSEAMRHDHLPPRYCPRWCVGRKPLRAGRVAVAVSLLRAAASLSIVVSLNFDGFPLV